MKKITIQRAVDLLTIMANGGNPEEATIEEVMLSCAMGATAIRGLGKVGTMAVEMADAAVAVTSEVKKLEGDIPVDGIPLNRLNGS